VGFGQINIPTEVSTPSAHNALPQEGHFSASSFIYYYLKTWSNVRLIPNTTYVNTNYEAFSQEKWTELWGTVVDGPILMDAPGPVGNLSNIAAPWIQIIPMLETGSDQTNEKLVPHHSHTAILIFLNSVTHNKTIRTQEAKHHEDWI
jgi:hypothetical protein